MMFLPIRTKHWVSLISWKAKAFLYERPLPWNLFGYNLCPFKNKKLNNISCQGCVEIIREALTDRDGVQKVEGNPQRKRITVTYQREKIELDGIRNRIIEAGYTVDETG